MNEILVMSMTTERFTHRREGVTSTWYKDIDTLFYSDHEDVENNTYKVCKESNYDSNVIKQTRILKDIKEGKVFYKNKNALDYKWVLFVDDDTFLNAIYFKKEINGFDENFVYGRSHPMFSLLPKRGMVYGGAGILISIKNIKKITKYDYTETNYGDVALSEILFRNKILIKFDERFNQVHTYEQSQDIMTSLEVNKNFTYHHCSPDQMKKYYSLIEF
jgi:hypothetical protein